VLHSQHTVAEKLAIQIHHQRLLKRQSPTGLFVSLTVGVVVSFNVRMSPYRSEQCWNVSTTLQSDSDSDEARLVTIHIIPVQGLQSLKLIHARSKQIYARLYSHGKTVLNEHYWSVRCI